MNCKIILIVALILIVIPCVAFGDVSPFEMAESMLKSIVAEDYVGATIFINEDAKKLITPDVIKAGWESVLAQFGSFTGYEPQESSEGHVSFKCAFSNASAKFTCVFDSEGMISTFSIMPLSYGTKEPLALQLPDGATQKAIKLFEGTSKELNGLLTLPSGYNKETPVVIMVQGSGPSDMDETVYSNKPFRDIAYALAGSGIASIRHDKITYSHPELFTKAEDITIGLELIEPALEALRLAKEAGFTNVYLLGHSLGGMMAPYVMAESGNAFKGGIILAGSPRKFSEIMYDQSIAVTKESGITDEAQLQTALDQIDASFEASKSLCEMTREEAIVQTDAVMGMPAYYLWTVDSIDRRSLPVSNGVPLLILQGEDDFQVTYAEDFGAWKELLADRTDLFTLRSYPGLNHIFTPAVEGCGISQVEAAYSVASYVDSNVTKDICEWINAH